MNEYLIKGETLTGIADEVRAMTGVTGVINPGNMKTHLNAANADVNTEANLIAQIIAALQGKAAGNGGIDTSDATASADEIFYGETAYVDGEKITGSFTINNELSAQDDLIAQIQSAVENLPDAN